MNRSGPLSDLVIVDLTQFLAGPYATLILGDLGARIIKVEPLEGDMSRTVAPYFYNGTSSYFLSVNRNKESLALDLKTAEGRKILLDLVANADAVIENYKPGVMDRLGLGFDTLKSANPNIIVCAISGFGQNGPYREMPAYDIIVQAMSGGMSITGEKDGVPVRAGVPIGDLSAGMFGVIGVLSHLTAPREKRQAQHIDISMLDCQISMLSYQAAYYLHSGKVPGQQGRAHDSIPTYRAFRCCDGIEVVVAANTEAMWQRFCEAVGRPELVDDERFRLNRDRLQNRAVLEPLLEQAVASFTSTDFLRRLVDRAVPAGPINDLKAALSNTQVAHRGMVATIADGAGGSIRVAGNPIAMTGARPGTHRYPPALGGDTHAILRDVLKLDEDEIGRLEREGIVRTTSGAGRT